MAITVWHSSRDFADWFVANTFLAGQNVAFEPLAASDASQPARFHKMPDHLKQILYLDSPDVIVESDGEPIISVEVTAEAGTGHNAFQRFSRIIAAVENEVPALYIYPEAKVVHRATAPARWDAINPNVFAALERLMTVHDVPALLYYFPTQYRPSGGSANGITGDGLLYDPVHHTAPLAADADMQEFFAAANAIMQAQIGRGRARIIQLLEVRNRRRWMNTEWANKGGANGPFSPETATVVVPTAALAAYLQQYAPGPAFANTNILMQRAETVIYQVGGAFRSDPYTGAAAALDYLRCRNGPTFEDRDINLAVSFGQVSYSAATNTFTIAPFPRGSSVSADDFVDKVSLVRSQPNACLLAAPNFAAVNNIPRYYMQARYGCSFTKSKEIRIFAFFADALLFADGAFWREG